MSTRRTQAPRKRPESSALAGALAAGARDTSEGLEGSVEGDEAGEGAHAELRGALLAKLEATVKSNPDLDEAGREFLMRHYRDAVAIAQIKPTLVSKPDRGQWIGMLESLQADGLASEESVAGLVRKFDAALDPLDSPELDTAVEFARRCEQDGEQEALKWLETRREAAEESKRASAAGKHDANPAQSPTVAANKRVRSPRGPPA